MISFIEITGIIVFTISYVFRIPPLSYTFVLNYFKIIYVPCNILILKSIQGIRNCNQKFRMRQKDLFPT